MGEDIRIWEDPWLPKDLSFKVNSNTARRDGLEKVSGLIDPSTKAWKHDLTRNTFNQEDTESILSIPISSTQRLDRKIWHLSSNGSFTVKSAYHLEKEGMGSHVNVQAAQTSSSGGLSSVWKKLWGLKIRPKIKVFV